MNKDPQFQHPNHCYLPMKTIEVQHTDLENIQYKPVNVELQHLEEAEIEEEGGEMAVSTTISRLSHRLPNSKIISRLSYMTALLHLLGLMDLLGSVDLLSSMNLLG